MAQSNDKRISKNFYIELIQGDNYRYVFPCGLGQYVAVVQIRQGGAPYKSNCDVTIYGLSAETLRQASFLLANPLTQIDKRNKIKIWVGGDYKNNKITGGELAFQAEVFFASADFTPAPNIALRIVGAVGYFIDTLDAGTEMEIAEGTTYKQAFNQIAKKIGSINVFFNGVSGKELANKTLNYTLLSGSTWYQRACTLAEMLNLQISFENESIYIAKIKENLYDNDPFVISWTNELISYPTFTSDGITFRGIFNNNIKVGCYIDVYSNVPLASNGYKVAEKITTLSSEPNGQWQTQYTAYYREGADYQNL